MMSDFKITASLPTEIFDYSQQSESPDWMWNPKYDGHRVIIDYLGDEPKILNRKGLPYSARPFKVKVPPKMKGWMIDGEYVWNCKEPYVFVFDVLAVRGDPIMDYPYSKRISFLDIAQNTAGFTWSYPRFDVPQDKRLESLKSHPLIDGIVFKRVDSIYIPGRTTTWLKYKFTSSLDLVVTDLNIDDKANCEISVMDDTEGRTFPIGRASTTGMKIKKGDVVTVRFLEFTKRGRLREPRIVEVRGDKTPIECTVDQLIPHANL